MKIVCPECQAAYEIDVPESPVKDVSAKCAVCNSTFLVKEGSATQARHTHKTMSGPPLAQIDSASDADPDDDFLFGLQEDFSELHADHEDQSSEDEKNLDDYLDKILEEELEESTHQTTDKPIEQLEVDSTNFEMPSEEELDDLFDSIITEEVQTEDLQENSTVSTPAPETDPTEEDLDALFDDILNDRDSNEPGEIAKDTDENETEAVLADPDLLFEEDEASENETQGSDVAIPAIYSTEVTTQEDLPEDIPAEEEIFSQIDSKEGLEIASDTSTPETSDPVVADSENQESAIEAQAEDDTEQKSEENASLPLAAAVTDQENTEATETTEAVETAEEASETEDKKEEAVVEPEEEKSDDDLWAEAFADQENTEATETTGEEASEADDKKEETAGEPEEEKSDDDLWAEAFADQENTEATETTGEEAPEADDKKEETAEDSEEEKSDDDLWAEAFADQENTEATETTGEEASEADDKKEETAVEPEEEKSDDDLWAEAFADQENTEATETTGEEAPEADDKKEETAEDSEEEKSDAEPQAETALDQEESPEENSEPEEEEHEDANATSEFDHDEEVVEAEEEDPYAEYDDDDDEGEDDFSPPKKKSGLFSLPSTLTGKLVLGGGVLAVLLTGGGIYFALQTLAPPELTQMGKTKSEIPDGLKSKPVEETPADQQSDSENATTAINQQEPASPPEANSKKAPDITQELAKTNSPLDVALNADVSQGLVASFAPSNHAVELTAILPVAYNVNDIRVLSFSLEAEMSDEESAQVVREALPVFEKITLTTVEQLLEKKFFNDILYVQEKLKKNLQTNFNKTLAGGGRVKKINFKEFTIQ